MFLIVQGRWVLKILRLKCEGRWVLGIVRFKVGNCPKEVGVKKFEIQM